MKTLLTILFFADTFLLVGLSYWLFRSIDNTGSKWLLFILPVAMAVSIYLLSLLLRNYLRLRSDKH